VAGTTLGLAGFFLTYGERSDRQTGMGFAMFLAVPILAGFVLAIVGSSGRKGFGISVLSVFFTLVILVSLGKEGPLCALLCLPLLFLGIGVGVAVGLLVKRAGNKDQPGRTVVMFVAVPFLMFGARQAEVRYSHYARSETVISSVHLTASPEEVWSGLGNIDQVEATKPILMYVGLPIPVRCTLQGRGVGAKRTCYFESGRIEETVTRWESPYRLDLKIDRTAMPGRHWLGFEYASYELAPEGDRTLLKRTTVITSNLAPASYWRTFERLGVEQEHEYIFRDLQRRLGH
jgi:hypothetical protein